MLLQNGSTDQEVYAWAHFNSAEELPSLVTRTFTDQRPILELEQKRICQRQGPSRGSQCARQSEVHPSCPVEATPFQEEEKGGVSIKNATHLHHKLYDRNGLLHVKATSNEITTRP